jgi:hypothetical protein
MTAINELRPDALYKKCKPGEFKFNTTTELQGSGNGSYRAPISRQSQEKPHVLVLPCSLSLTECASQLKCPILFVP